MDMQKTFDKVAIHLLTQNKISMLDSGDKTFVGGSVPATEHSVMCAIGCLIANEHYSTSLEGRTPFESGVRKALNNSGCVYDFDGKEDQFMSDLQEVYDYFKPCDWKDKLKKLASKYNLSFNPPVDKV